MSEQRLREMLDNSAGLIGVGTPPYAAIVGKSRRRRLWVMAGAAVATGIAATFVMALVFTGDPDDGKSPIATDSNTTLLPLPTRNEPQSGGSLTVQPTAQIFGRLTLDNQCVRLQSRDSTYTAIWPQGWSAGLAANGDVTLMDNEGRAVARSGDFVSTGGGYFPPGRFSDEDEPCLAGVAEAAVVYGDVKVVEAQPLLLPTSDWSPGEGGEQAFISGTLTREGDCLYLTAGQRRVSVLWPAGFAAKEDPDGVVRLLASDGSELARAGDAIQANGGFTKRIYSGLPVSGCLNGTIAYIQSEVTVQADDGTVVLIADGGRDARVSGALTRVGNCAGIDDSVATWPTGTTVVSESPLTLRIPGLGEVSAGDELVGGGGYFDTATDDVALEVPASCGTTSVVTYRPLD